jgi:hypothetical protein
MAGFERLVGQSSAADSTGLGSAVLSRHRREHRTPGMHAYEGEEIELGRFVLMPCVGNAAAPTLLSGDRT